MWHLITGFHPFFFINEVEKKGGTVHEAPIWWVAYTALNKNKNDLQTQLTISTHFTKICFIVSSISQKKKRKQKAKSGYLILTLHCSWYFYFFPLVFSISFAKLLVFYLFPWMIYCLQRRDECTHISWQSFSTSIP